MKPLNILFLFLYITLSGTKADTGYQALLQWKESLAQTSSLNTWSLDDNHTIPCNWWGVTCSPMGNILQLVLRNAVINGTLHKLNMSSLYTLTRLDLSSNFLHGPIPPTISALSNLRFLDLGNNKFDGVIPPELGSLSELLDLRLYNNSLVGPIPFQISKLQKVQYFDLGDNHLENPDYSRLSVMQSVVHLSLYRNNLTLEFPLVILKFANLTYLDLSENQSTGSIPDLSATNLIHLKHLNLSYNNFNGKIPASLRNLSWLRDLRMGSNNFCDGIPDFLGSISELERLELFANPLGGSLPSSLGQLQALRHINLHGVRIKSTIPEELSLAGNKLSGEIPTWIGRKMPFLAVLRLRSNSFHGEISSQLAQLKFLHVLDLSENKLAGNIPQALGSMVSMSKNNQLQSTRDFDIYNYFWKMSRYHHSSNFGILIKWKGNDSNIPLKSGFVTTIDLASNHLSGIIPKETTNLSSLVVLNLANNSIGGSITDMIGNMKQLESLDLSMNRLTGTIPLSLGSLNFLEWLNLSYNNLSGTIPMSPQLQTLDDPSIYAGNLGLCGFPLGQICSNSETVDSDNYGPHNEKLGFHFWVLLDSSILGFVLGFWVFFGVVALIKSWRFRYLILPFY
ncbi:hypothetical protein LUZ61_013007 [Rhynchospora tenuis]|uniref:Leucine-rich repeat-containing N-terminal plant-type domain-containing protein n=1 Tax=Rhynchospora tenuis TaxID=198213 RepID=A0AAD6F1N4_9POAL|nr:hypothetical protein LUZ61_013007 [Rhynchospora tenuis]